MTPQNCKVCYVELSPYSICEDTCDECLNDPGAEFPEEKQEKKTRKPRSEAWVPNISKDEVWIDVPSPYKAYKDGV